MSDEQAFLAQCSRLRPGVFLVLGSGLGEIAARVQPEATLPYSDVSGLPGSGVSGHRGRFLLGMWAAQVVLVAEGRIHYYEGHPWDVVTRPVQLAAGLGVRCAVLTNAAGGIREDLEPGSLMPIRDHLEWNRPYPWREAPVRSPYDPDLLELLVTTGQELGERLQPGVYGAVCGPSYETPAEIRALRWAGADAVGMSTSREALAGRAAGLRVAAISLITNRAAGLTGRPLDHQEVLETGKAAAVRLANLLERFFLKLRDHSFTE